jgi:D-glycerate 3-kinase
MAVIDKLLRAEGLPAAYRQTVDAVHRPVAKVIAQRHAGLGRPMVVGLCGAQGGGKSTMSLFLKALLDADGLSTAVLSLDDLYLTRPEREALGGAVHPLLRTRGVPGTHDTGLGLALIDILTDGAAAEVSLPRFDKAEDTRAPSQTWPRVQAPVDVLLFEGWCVGAAPEADEALIPPINALERDQDADGRWRRSVNDRLKTDYAHLFARIDLLALLQAPSFEAVLGWRALQERKLAERVAREGGDGQGVMSPAGIADFLMHYQRLTEHILREMPDRADIVMPMTVDQRITGVRFRE